MRLNSLILQAFRGFNKKEEFSLESDIIILYGPNGHGKTSIYDAIEWALTGGIYRFEDASQERKRTKFIRNLHADYTERSYVELGIELEDGSRFKINRECTATSKDRSDYGKYKLRIYDVMDQLYNEDERAELTLKKWLIHKDWLPDIESPTTMLSLTHILSQDKMGDFLRGMPERNRYDALSTIFGTDHFEKYRDGFRKVRNNLNNKHTALIAQITEKKSNEENLIADINELEIIVAENKEADFKKELQKYLNLYPESDLDKANPGIILKTVINNQQNLEIDLNRTNAEYQLLKDIKKNIPNMIQAKRTLTSILNEQNLLQQYKDLSISKIKVDQLLSAEKVFHDDNKRIQYLKSLQKDSNLSMSSMFNEKEGLLKVKENLDLKLETSSWQEGLEFLEEIKEEVTEKNFNLLNNAFNNMFKEYKFIEKNRSIKQDYLLQIELLEKTIKQIESADELYSTFLSSLNNYMLVIPEEENSCPACGTEGIEKKDILKEIEVNQLRVNENLPTLRKSIHEKEVYLSELKKSIQTTNENIQKNVVSVQELLNHINNSIKMLSIKVSKEKQNQSIRQQEIDLIGSKLNSFKKECMLLSISTNDNIRGELELRKKDLLGKLDEVNLTRLNAYKQDSYLPEELKIKQIDDLIIEEQERILQNRVSKNELEINKYNRLFKSSEVLEVSNDFDEFENNVSYEIRNIEERLQKYSAMQVANIRLKSTIEIDADNIKLIDWQKRLESLKIQLDRLDKMEVEMGKDLEYLKQLIDKSPEAISNLNDKIFTNLKATIQGVFEQINSHPTFTELDLVMGSYRNNNGLTINVSKVNGNKEIIANAPYVFSSAQVNSIALSLFLAMTLKQKWSPLQLIGMDDPIQSMDEINVISFIDLLRLFIDKHNKQIIISTHDYSFYKMMMKKFRYHQITIIEYEAYSDNGPSIKKQLESNCISKEQLDFNYKVAREALLQLDVDDND